MAATCRNPQPRQTESCHLRFDRALILRLRAYARETGRTLNGLCEWLLFQAAEARDKEMSKSRRA